MTKVYPGAHEHEEIGTHKDGVKIAQRFRGLTVLLSEGIQWRGVLTTYRKEEIANVVAYVYG